MKEQLSLKSGIQELGREECMAIAGGGDGIKSILLGGSIFGFAYSIMRLLA